MALPMRHVRLDDELRALRLATKLACRGRWEREKNGVIVGLISRFKSDILPGHDWSDSDLRWQKLVNLLMEDIPALGRSPTEY